MFTLFVTCCRCVEDVRQGDDGRVPCPLVSALQTVILTPRRGIEPVELYRNDVNLSTEKYVLSADFSTVTVRDMTVSDEGVYSCDVVNGSSGSGRWHRGAYVNIAVYGKPSAVA